MGCIFKHNNTHAKIDPPEPVQVAFNARKRRDAAQQEFESIDPMDSSSLIIDDPPEPPLTRQRRALPNPKLKPGISPLKVNYAMNYDPVKNANWVSPSFSSQIFKKDDVTKVFFLLLMLVIFGEALASPAIVIADSAVLAYLGDEAGKRYGHQRMFGSCGWAIAMFVVGIALDHSTFPLRKCEPLPQVCYGFWVLDLLVSRMIPIFFV